jgi:hypothetical protein
MGCVVAAGYPLFTIETSTNNRTLAKAAVTVVLYH